MNLDYGTVQAAIRKTQARRAMRAVVRGFIGALIVAVVIALLAFFYFQTALPRAQFDMAANQLLQADIKSLERASGPERLPMPSKVTVPGVSVVSEVDGFLMVSNISVPHILQRVLGFAPLANSAAEACIAEHGTRLASDALQFGGLQLAPCTSAKPTSMVAFTRDLIVCGFLAGSLAWVAVFMILQRGSTRER